MWKLICLFASMFRCSCVACASSVHNREVYQVHTSSVASSTFWHAKKLSTQYNTRQTTISQKGFFKSIHLYWKTLSWFVGTSSETIHETDSYMTFLLHGRSFCGRQPRSSSFLSVGSVTSCALCTRVPLRPMCLAFPTLWQACRKAPQKRCACANRTSGQSTSPTAKPLA